MVLVQEYVALINKQIRDGLLGLKDREIDPFTIFDAVNQLMQIQVNSILNERKLYLQYHDHMAECRKYRELMEKQNEELLERLSQLDLQLENETKKVKLLTEEKSMLTNQCSLNNQMHSQVEEMSIQYHETLKQLEVLEEKYQRLQKQHDRLQVENNSYQTNERKLKAEINKLTRVQEDLLKDKQAKADVIQQQEIQIADDRQKISKQNFLLQEQSKELDELRELTKQLNFENSKLKTDNEKYQLQIEQFTQENTSLKSNLNLITNQGQACQEQLDDLKYKFDNAMVDLQKYTQLYMNTHEQLIKCQKDLEFYIDKSDKLHEIYNANTIKIYDLENENRALKQLNEKLTMENSELRAIINRLETEILELKIKLARLEIYEAQNEDDNIKFQKQLKFDNIGPNINVSDFGLSIIKTDQNAVWSTCCSGIGIYKGKRRWGYRIVKGLGNILCGLIVNVARTQDLGFYIGHDHDDMSYCNNGKKEVQGKGMPYGSPYGKGDYIEAELDMDKRTLEFFKNGISQGIAYQNIANKAYYPAISLFLIGDGISIQ